MKCTLTAKHLQFSAGAVGLANIASEITAKSRCESCSEVSKLNSQVDLGFCQTFVTCAKGEVDTTS